MGQKIIILVHAHANMIKQVEGAGKSNSFSHWSLAKKRLIKMIDPDGAALEMRRKTLGEKIRVSGKNLRQQQ